MLYMCKFKKIRELRIYYMYFKLFAKRKCVNVKQKTISPSEENRGKIYSPECMLNALAIFMNVWFETRHVCVWFKFF